MKWRLVICVISFLGLTINYAMRVGVGIIAADRNTTFPFYGYRGLILGAFLAGYASTNVFGGFLARLWGAQPVLVLAGIVWATCDAVTPILAPYGLGPLLCCRVAVGLGSGLLVPPVCQLASDWTPTLERGSLMTFVFSGMNAGPILGMILTPQILQAAGYVCVFEFWSSAAAVWTIMVLSLISSSPEQNKWCRLSGEAAHIQNDRQRVSTRPDSVMIILRHRSAWGIIVGQIGFDSGFQILLNWLPEYLSQPSIGLDLSQHPLIAAMPYVCGWFGAILAGQASDALSRAELPGWRPRHVRKLAQMLGSGLGSTFLILSAITTGNTAFMSLLVAFFFYTFQVAGYIVSIADVFPSNAGTFMGVCNTFSMLAAAIAQPAADAILSALNSWLAVFGMLASVVILCSVAFCILIDDRPLEVLKQHECAHAVPLLA